MTNPDTRNDPWREALSCYEFFADEVITTGSDWPKEFKWSDIGKYFQEGLEKSNGDWNIRMDIDYFFHEKDRQKLLKYLNVYSNFPLVSFPQYQFYTTDRFHVKTRLCIGVNKKFKNNIKLNGGGDLCLATFNGELVDPNMVPNIPVPIYQYDSIFRTKNIIKSDRARFARAWRREFGNFGSRGEGDEESSYKAWFNDVKSKYPKHIHKIKFENHPEFIQNSIEKLNKNQFGYSAFGLKDSWKSSPKNYIKGYKSLYLDTFINNLNKKNSKYYCS